MLRYGHLVTQMSVTGKNVTAVTGISKTRLRLRLRIIRNRTNFHGWICLSYYAYFNNFFKVSACGGQFLNLRLALCLSIWALCLFFTQNEAQYAYKNYTYKKKHVVVNFLQSFIFFRTGKKKILKKNAIFWQFFFFNFEINRNYLNAFYVKILGHLGIFFHKFGRILVCFIFFGNYLICLQTNGKKNRKNVRHFGL